MMASRGGWLRVFTVAHFLALALWISTLIAAGVAAAGAFATLPDLGITLRDHSAFEIGDSNAHGRLAAGKMLEPVFAALDMAQVPLAVVSIGALVVSVLLSGQSIRRTSLLLRTTCLVVAALLLTLHLALVAPRMNRDLRAYWAAAEAGDMGKARAHREAFDEQHPRADVILKINLVLLLTALSAGAWAMGAPPPNPSELEPPLLSRRPAR